MSAPVSLSKRQLIVGVVETLQLRGGQVPEGELEFWLELATYVGLTPRTRDPSRVAQAVLDALDEEWDDDFVDEDGVLTIGLYETLTVAIQRQLASSAAGQTIEEEEDDDSVQGLRNDLHINPTTYGLQTVYEWVHSGLLVLSPEWQRNFVWKAKKQKRLVESILLGLPIPSFLIFSDSTDGRKYVIDGRQRLETVARFKSPPEPRGSPRLRFKTFTKKEPGWGPDEVLGEAASKYYHQLPQRHKTQFDSAPLVLAEFRDIAPSDLYQVFKRYNTGAVALNAAEIRNAVYQASNLHKMLFRLGGEQQQMLAYADDDEATLATDLRETMQPKRVQRYGAYDFIGRYFAFAYAERGSVAKATLSFMERYKGASEQRVEEFRREFLDVFAATLEWYPSPLFLADPDEGRFHAFLGTLQLVSTKFMLGHIRDGRTDLETVRGGIGAQWLGFARDRLSRKQNSTLFWNSQRTWVSMLEVAAGTPRSYPSWDWDADLQPPEPLEA